MKIVSCALKLSLKMNIKNIVIVFAVVLMIFSCDDDTNQQFVFDHAGQAIVVWVKVNTWNLKRKSSIEIGFLIVLVFHWF